MAKAKKRTVSKSKTKLGKATKKAVKAGARTVAMKTKRVTATRSKTI